MTADLTNASHPDDKPNQPLNAILNRALSRLRCVLPEPVGLSVDVADDCLRVRANCLQMEQALFSAGLIAWQSTGYEKIQIMVEVREVFMQSIVLDEQAEMQQGGLPPRGHICVLISNSSRLQPGPFASTVPFVESPRAEAIDASRLRLLDIQAIVDEHNGWLATQTEPKKGTTFEIYLPVALPMEVPTINASGTGLKHIIYVDDYEPMRDLVSEVMPDAGFEVSCFESGPAALTLLQENPDHYDALVTDYRLLGFSGIELLRQVRAIRPHFPVILISGYIDDALIAMALAEDVTRVVSKTRDLGELCADLRELLGSATEPQLATYSDWARIS